jgi:hypothetical protein
MRARDGFVESMQFEKEKGWKSSKVRDRHEHSIPKDPLEAGRHR